MSSTTTKSLIGTSDINWNDGVNDTFTRLTSTGGTLTLNKIGTEVNVAEAYGAGTPSFAALSLAVGQIGTTNKRTLLLKSGTWSITSDLTIPSNCLLKVAPGAKFSVATTKTLTINGPIEAGPFQIFSWAGTGAITISGSPTVNCHIEWWGGIADATTDCTAIFTKAAASIGGRQTIRVNGGFYRIASALSFAGTNGCFGMAGNSRERCGIYIDIDASTDGVTFLGGDGNYRLTDMAFIGPVNKCKDAVVIGGNSPTNSAVIGRNLAIFAGAAGYALRMAGNTYWYFDNLDIGHALGDFTSIGAGCRQPANGVAITGTYSNNSGYINAHISPAYSGTPATYGYYITNAANVLITGSVEGCEYPVYMNGTASRLTQAIKLDNMYILDGNTYGPYIANSRNITIDTCYCEQGTSGNPATITNSKDVKISNTIFDKLIIQSDCVNVVMDGVSAYTGVTDYAVDTICLTPIQSLFVQPFKYMVSNPPQAVNVFANGDFSRFTSGTGTPPEGWTADSGLWSRNTTITRQSGQCGEFNTNGGDRTPTRAILADELNKIKGSVATFSVNIMMDVAPATYGYLYLGLTVPTWAAGTVYDLHDCVVPTTPDGYMYRAIAVTGDQKSHAATEPTWPATNLLTVVDNHVTWQRINKGDRSDQFDVSMVGTLAPWKQMMVSGFVPRNATAASVYFSAYKASGGDVKYYVADACLTSGGWTPFYAPTQNQTAGTLTLSNGGGTTTAVDDVNVTAISKILLVSTSANAAAAVGAAAGLYISAKTAGQFTVTHPASPGAAATMDYFVFN